LPPACLYICLLCHALLLGQTPTQASETLFAGPLRAFLLPSWRATSSSLADALQPPARSHRLRAQPWWLSRMTAPRRRQPTQRLTEPCEDDG
jgi:hypothetical protein